MPSVRGPARSFEQTARGFRAVLCDGLCLLVQVLEEDLVRVQVGDPQTEERKSWMVVDGSGDVPWTGRDKTDLSSFSLPAFSLEYDSGAQCAALGTRALRVVVRLAGDLKLEWSDAEGRVFLCDQDAEAYQVGPSAFRHTVKRLEAGEEYFGFGECCGKLNKAGERLRVDPRDAMGYDAERTDPLYKHWPYHFAKTQGNALYGMLYDTMRTGVFDLGKEISAFRGPYRYFETARPECGLDLYVFTGEQPAQLSARLMHLIGKPAMPPRWALGYLASGMSYTESANAQAELDAFVANLNKHVPRRLCTAFHLSSGYTTSPQQERCVFTWNLDKIPQPREMFGNFARHEMHVIANVKPWLLESHPGFAKARQCFFSHQRNPNEPAMGQFWAGGAGTSGLGCYLDFTNPQAVAWWKREMTSSLLALGCDAIWNDNNEYEVNDLAATCAYEDKDVEAAGRALHPLLMARASLEALRDFYPDQPALLVVSRSGSIGTHRYAAQTWSGDNSTCWRSLRYNITMCLGLGLSGWPASGCDVGGFAGARPDPELFYRWVQSGVFFPRFSIHSSVWKDGSNTEPWMYPEVADRVVTSLKVRAKLAVQLYSLHLESGRLGGPVARPLLFHYFDEEEARKQDFAFMWGRHLLVAPVHQPGATTVWEAYLPGQGREVWYDLEHKVALAGGALARLALLEDTSESWFGGCPVLVREGGGFVLNALEDQDARTVVLAGSEAELVWYEDGGWEYVCLARAGKATLVAKLAADRDADKRPKPSPKLEFANVLLFTRDAQGKLSAREQQRVEVE